MELLDELYSGVPSVGSADVQGAFGASYALTVSALLLVPGVVALCVEPVLFLLADRYPRKWFVCGGLFAMAAAAFVMAVADSLMLVTVGLSLAFVGSGSGVALSQATLSDAHPDERERILARWALFGEAGDLLAPLLLAGLAATGLGFRTAYGFVGILVLVWALLLAVQRFPDPLPDSEPLDEEEAADAVDGQRSQPGAAPGLVAAFLLALKNRTLLFWLLATTLCDLLDEIVVVFAVLHLRDELGADGIERSLVVGAGVAGALAGAALSDRLLARWPPLRLLFLTSAACTVVYVGWLLAPNVWLSALLFLLVGATAAPMYPIASAQAYRALPGRSGAVHAAGHLFTPLSIGAPLVLGLVADAAGVRWALALLIVQPLGLAAAALLAAPRTAGDGDGSAPAEGPSPGAQ